MPWQHDAFVQERLAKGRRLLADSDNFRGSTDLQTFLAYMELTERLHQAFLDDAGQPRQDLTTRDKQQGLTLLLLSKLRWLETLPTTSLIIKDCYEPAKAAAEELSGSDDAGVQLLGRLSWLALAVDSQRPELAVSGAAALLSEWHTLGAAAAALQQHQRAERFDPLITAAEMRALAIAVRQHYAEVAITTAQPDDAPVAAQLASAQSAAADLLRSGCCTCPAFWRLRQADIAAACGAAPAARASMYRDVLQAAEREKAHLVAFFAQHRLLALLVGEEGWPLAQARTFLSGAKQSLKLVKKWALERAVYLLVDLQTRWEGAVQQASAAHPGCATLPALRSAWDVKVAGKTTCSSCGRSSQQLRKCSACKLAAYCSRECQLKHWKEGGHKAECAALAAQARAGSSGS